MKRFFLFNTVLMLAFLSAVSFASEKDPIGFKPTIVGGLNLTQNSTSNWTAGGENAYAYTFTLNSQFLNNQPKYRWKITGDFAFGQTKVGSQDLRNAVDRIDINGLLTYKYGLFINPYVSAGLLTQFATGYDYSKTPPLAKSGFFDPAFITGGTGLGWTLRPKFTTRLGLGIKETITQKYSQFGYADKASTPNIIEKTKFETGIQSVTELETKLANNLLYISHLGLFSSFANMTAVDVKWNNTWSVNVSKFISINLIVNLLYDEDISSKIQIQEALAIGLTANFIK
ncbi:MAG: DUF3078 domain-containing protein [Calditrichaeota bacterium]|nr:DUF3078 domain-containing protein [Calditrichota bacterium]